MKKLATFLAATAVLVYTGCNMEEESITGPSISKGDGQTEIAIQKKAPIAIVINSGIETRSSLSIDEQEIVRASFQLITPSGTELFDTWEKNGSDTLFFDAEGSGMYYLTVVESDDEGSTTVSKHNFEVLAGKNYKLNITLGSSIEVVVDEGSTPTIPDYTNLVFNGKWYSVSDTINGSYVNIDYLNNGLVASFHRPAGWGTLICATPYQDFTDFSSVSIEMQNSRPMMMSLVDSDDNTYDVKVPANQNPEKHIFQFDEFERSFWTNTDLEFDLANVNSIAFWDPEEIIDSSYIFIANMTLNK